MFSCVKELKSKKIMSNNFDLKNKLINWKRVKGVFSGIMKRKCLLNCLFELFAQLQG